MEVRITKNNLLDIIKSSKKKGECQFEDCTNNPIQAHSISKSLLKMIAESGKVVVLRNNMFKAHLSDESVSEFLDGINKATTFPGFCALHDNDLFKSIDNVAFDCSKNQAFLYAFRILSKELVRRKQVLNWFPNIKFSNTSEGTQTDFEELNLGLDSGLRSLVEHKKIYDRILATGDYEDIGYSLFEMTTEPWFLFSGISYPDYDFQGNLIQDLADRKSIFQMITFTSVKLLNGWGILFVWEKKSDQSSVAFFNSLKTQVKNNGEDSRALLNAIFRFVISRSECYAFNKSQWASLPDSSKRSVIERANNVIKYPFVDSQFDLVEGLDGIFKEKIRDIREEFPEYK